MNLVDTLLAAGIREYDITEQTNGDVEIATSDGGRICIGEHSTGGWWDYTAYDSDDRDWRTDGGTHLPDVAARVARLTRQER